MIKIVLDRTKKEVRPSAVEITAFLVGAVAGIACVVLIVR